MKSYYVDLHVHIGRTERGDPIKISASKDLTFFHIAREASQRKGLDIIGIIDCHSPLVQEEIGRLLDQGRMSEVPEGGIRFQQTIILLGCEMEVKDEGMGPAHLLAFIPSLASMRDFTNWLKKHMNNVHLSSQRVYVPARVLQYEVIKRGGALIPAHIFTPHKSVYGSCTDQMSRLLDPDGIAAVELGLSSDTIMAGYISELDRYTFVTNSDAHSLGKIGREYNRMLLADANFAEVLKALKGCGGRKVEANYGLNPRLGKYYRTYCTKCGRITAERTQQPALYGQCPYCGSNKLIRGVLDRILSIADRNEPFVAPNRPPYYYQVPLEFIPGLGKKTLDKLLDTFGTEMNILHRASREELMEAAGEQIAQYILMAREGKLALSSGGGGHYGKVIR